MGGRKRTLVRASKVNDPEFLENEVIFILHKIIRENGKVATGASVGARKRGS